MLKRRLILLGTLVASGTAAYFLLLTKEARRSMSTAFESVGKDVALILDGMGVGDDAANTKECGERNKQKVMERWKKIGF